VTLFTEDYLTVSELTSKIKDVIELEFPFCRVGGEITNYSLSPAGHHYFSLKDEEAQLKVVLFRGRARNVVGELKNGSFAVVSGPVTVYEKRGEYQLIAETVLVSGIGNLLLKFQQLKEKLEREGIFDRERKKEIPYFCSRVGVVTSIKGAAVRDIVRIIRNRFPNTEIVIAPASVQGEEAVGEICEALRMMDEHGCVDVIIVGRGGGSIEDLWAFNEEEVVRTVASLKTPVISAVGHETDFTLTDFAADRRASTPSNAAEMAVLVKSEVIERLDHLLARIKRGLYQRIESLRGRVNRLRGDLKDPLSVIRGLRLKLADLEERLNRRSPEAIIRDGRVFVSDCLFRMSRSLSDVIGNKKTALAALKGKLTSLDPKGILERGYSITLDYETGKIVISSADVSPGGKLKTLLHRGELVSIVEEVKE